MRSINALLSLVCSSAGIIGLLLSAANESILSVVFCGFWLLFWQKELHRDMDKLRNGE